MCRDYPKYKTPLIKTIITECVKNATHVKMLLYRGASRLFHNQRRLFYLSVRDKTKYNRNIYIRCEHAKSLITRYL